MEEKLEKEIVQRIEEGNSLDDAGEHDKALAIYIAEWDNFPGDKYKEDLGLWIASCIFQAYFDMLKFNEAKHWALECLKMDLPDYATEEYMRVGEVYYELNEFDQSYKYFEIAYERGKKRAFKEHDNKYWTFFKQKLV